MGAVRHIRMHGLAGPAGALSHAPPALRLVPAALRGGERAPRRAQDRPWRCAAASALLHAAAISAILWTISKPQPSAERFAAEIVFWAAESADSRSGEPPMREATDSAGAETAPIEIAADNSAADEKAAVSAVSAETDVKSTEADRPAPSAAALPAEATGQVVEPEQATAPEPLPAPTHAEIHREPAPPLSAPAARAVSESRPLPLPPRPRPVATKAKPAEPKPVEMASAPEPAPTPAPASESSGAAPSDASDAPAAQSASASPSESAEPPVIHEPRYRHPPAPPRFPSRAIELRQQGTVIVRALVAPDGTSGEIVVWRSSGYAMLDAAALRAVRDWAFEPASIDGRRVAAWVEVPVRFAIR